MCAVWGEDVLTTTFALKRELTVLENAHDGHLQTAKLQGAIATVFLQTSTGSSLRISVRSSSPRTSERALLLPYTENRRANITDLQLCVVHVCVAVGGATAHLAGAPTQPTHLMRS